MRTLLHPQFPCRPKNLSHLACQVRQITNTSLPTDGKSGRFEWHNLLFRGPTSTLARRQIINRSCQSDAIQPSIMSGFVEEAAPNVFWQGPLEVWFISSRLLPMGGGPTAKARRRRGRGELGSLEERWGFPIGCLQDAERGASCTWQ